jgi:pyruvate dehydrogenase E2 component (dihydrolipoamide acetyltransferase)
MAFEIRVPRLGWTMETATFGSWLVGDGATVREGEVIFTMESDKALQDVEAMASGVLRILPGAPATGAVMDVGTLLGYVLAPGEAPPWESAPAAAAPAAAPARAAAPPPAPGAVPARHEETRAAAAPAASPRARKVARALGVDWAQLRGSGRTGRIVERDVRAAAAGASGRRKGVPLSSIRTTIAERMHAGTSVAAPFTLMTEADATELARLKDRLAAAWEAEGDRGPTFTDLFIVLVADALGAHPALNARFDGGEVFLEEAVDLALAIDTPHGLVAPPIRRVQGKNIREIAREARELVEKARARTLTAEELRGGTFTLTNLGMCGIDGFTPILNLPQCAILGVGRVLLKPAVHQGIVVPRLRVALSLTVDHRVIDGGPAARFLATVREHVEAPARWFLA